MPKRVENITTKLIVCLAIFLCIGLSSSRVTADYIRIKGSVVNVRQGPGTTYQVLFQAKQGDEFDLLKTEGLWCLVRLEGGEQAWVFGRLIEILPGERPSGQRLSSGSKVDQGGHESVWAGHLDKILILVPVFVALLIFWKRRLIFDLSQRKLREISGYRREQPFRYDNRNPKDDRWEL